MNDSIFRKKSIERINSPDALNNTIRLTSPAVWLVLVALVLVLVGFFIWAIFGKINSTVNTVVTNDILGTGCYVSEKDVMEVAPGMEVIVGSKTYTLGSMCSDNNTFAYKADEFVKHLGQFDDDEYLYYFIVLGNVESGAQKGTIVTEKISAINFLWNY